MESFWLILPRSINMCIQKFKTNPDLTINILKFRNIDF